jgi:membrane protease YdiL (CAAX protease family)
MSDPTGPILSCAFVAVALGFVLAAGWRRLAVARNAVDPGESGVGLPPPIPVRVPVWFYRPLDLVGAILVFSVYAILVLSAVWVGQEQAIMPDAASLVMTIGFQFVMAGLVTFSIAGRCGPMEWLGLRGHSWLRVSLLAVAAVLFMWLVSGGLFYAGYIEWMESLGVQTTQDSVQLLREADDPLTLGLMVLAAVLVAPLCEELVFRGYLYPLMKKYSGAAAATFCTSLFFAAAHGHLAAVIPLGIFGVVLVLLYEKTGSLWAPVAAHFLFNGATVGVQFAARHYEIPIGLIP